MNKPVSLTIVIAAFNEEAALPALHPRLSAVLDSLGLASGYFTSTTVQRTGPGRRSAGAGGEAIRG